MALNNIKANGESFIPPPLERTADNDISATSLAAVIEWFLAFDERVAMIKHRNVEEVFQWKQEGSRREDENTYLFNHAEDRLAIGILNAVAENRTEQALHEWISKLLSALDDATKANEEIAQSYELAKIKTDSALVRANAIPSEQGRFVYLNYWWLEALCMAEIRVLGWIYKELYSRSFSPENY